LGKRKIRSETGISIEQEGSRIVDASNKNLLEGKESRGGAHENREIPIKICRKSEGGKVSNKGEGADEKESFRKGGGGRVKITEKKGIRKTLQKRAGGLDQYQE